MIQQDCDLILQANHILTSASNNASISHGAIAVKNGTIAAIGESDRILATWMAPAVKNLGESLLMPGLINAHTHVPMTFLRGFADDLPLMEWLTKHIFPVEAHLTKEIVALGARWGMYEMMRTGTTGFVDSYLLEEQVLSTADAMGMRCAGGEVVFAFPSPAYLDREGVKKLYAAHAEKYKGHKRIQIAVMPHSVYTTDDDLLRDCMTMAEKLDLMLHIHLSESSGEVAQSMQLHGLRPVAYAHKLGLLNGRTWLAHMVDLTQEEIDLVARSGAHVVHNPVSNLKLASGIAPIASMSKAGISIGLGTDGACSNNTLDMFETLKTAAILAKAEAKDATVIPAEEALHMATVESAGIFRTPGLGSLSVGAPADIIALDMTQPNLCPLFNPTSHAVYAASGKDCIMTMVDGKILYEKGNYSDGMYDDTRAAICDIISWVKDKTSAQ